MVLNELADASFNFADCRIIFVRRFGAAPPLDRQNRVLFASVACVSTVSTAHVCRFSAGRRAQHAQGGTQST